MYRTERCDRCKWWDLDAYAGEHKCGDEGVVEAFCRRFPPPTCVQSEKHGDYSYRSWPFPVTYENDFCGEFALFQESRP